jgi:hypothetical protein
LYFCSQTAFDLSFIAELAKPYHVLSQEGYFSHPVFEDLAVWLNSTQWFPESADDKTGSAAFERANRAIMAAHQSIGIMLKQASGSSSAGGRVIYLCKLALVCVTSTHSFLREWMHMLTPLFVHMRFLPLQSAKKASSAKHSSTAKKRSKIVSIAPATPCPYTFTLHFSDPELNAFKGEKGEHRVGKAKQRWHASTFVKKQIALKLAVGSPAYAQLCHSHESSSSDVVDHICRNQV